MKNFGIASMWGLRVSGFCYPSFWCFIQLKLFGAQAKAAKNHCQGRDLMLERSIARLFRGTFVFEFALPRMSGDDQSLQLQETSN
jgi:hypothetical protein